MRAMSARCVRVEGGGGRWEWGGRLGRIEMSSCHSSPHHDAGRGSA